MPEEPPTLEEASTVEELEQAGWDALGESQGRAAELTVGVQLIEKICPSVADGEEGLLTDGVAWGLFLKIRCG